jgi:hypothetical protein
MGQSKELHECPLARGSGGRSRRDGCSSSRSRTWCWPWCPARPRAAFTHGLPVAAGLFLASAALSLLLPKTAVADEHG